MSTPSATASRPRPTTPLRTWLARFGIAGFAFFFLKGLAWLALLLFGGYALTG